eukprot:1522448-Prymnesium_polylepis.1
MCDGGTWQDDEALYLLVTVLQPSSQMLRLCCRKRSGVSVKSGTCFLSSKFTSSFVSSTGPSPSQCATSFVSSTNPSPISISSDPATAMPPTTSGASPLIVGDSSAATFGLRCSAHSDLAHSGLGCPIRASTCQATVADNQSTETRGETERARKCKIQGDPAGGARGAAACGRRVRAGWGRVCPEARAGGGEMSVQVRAKGAEAPGGGGVCVGGG